MMSLRTSFRRAASTAAALAAAVVLAACANLPGSGRHFDVDAFLRASDTALPEVVANPDFLAATRAPAADCAAMLQSVSSGVLESLPSAGRGPAWLLHPATTPSQVWLVIARSGGERTCHGPLPADAMKALVARSAS